MRTSERRLAEDGQDNNFDDDSDDALDHSERQSESIVLDSEGRVTALTQFDQYVNKGRYLEDFTLYDYVACVRMIRVRKRHQTTIEVGAQDGVQVPSRGRPRRHQYSFESGGCFDETFAQVLSSVPAIPQLVGPPPPQYPGDKPLRSGNEESFKKWEEAAKLFVEFYAYLFLP